MIKKLTKPKAAKAPLPTEYALCCQVAHYLTLCERFKAISLFTHIPNGEQRSSRTGGKLKTMGVRAGMPDYLIVLPFGSVVFLEIKRGPNEKLNKNQVPIHMTLGKAGVLTVTAHKLEAVRDLIKAAYEQDGVPVPELPKIMGV